MASPKSALVEPIIAALRERRVRALYMKSGMHGVGRSIGDYGNHGLPQIYVMKPAGWLFVKKSGNLTAAQYTMREAMSAENVRTDVVTTVEQALTVISEWAAQDRLSREP